MFSTLGIHDLIPSVLLLMRIHAVSIYIPSRESISEAPQQLEEDHLTAVNEMGGFEMGYENGMEVGLDGLVNA